MQWRDDDITITDDPTAVDLDVVHGFLVDAYWSPGVPREVLARAVEGSLCLTALDGDALVGFGRIVTDRATFAYLCDVFVLPEHRGRGIGKALARAAVEHPDLRGVRRYVLATRDAHGLYEPFGFRPAPAGSLLEIKRDAASLYEAS